MRQHPINLLPAAVQARTAKGAAVSRWVTIAVIGAVALGAVCTWSRIRLGEARDRFDAARARADVVLLTEQKQKDLEQTLKEIEDRVHRYSLLAHPLDVSRVAATIVNLMPESAVLDRLDIQAGARRPVQNARVAQPDPKQKQARPPRMVTGELAGFAVSDQDIAELVSRLAERTPFRDVSLDFTRHRVVRERNAREFRISFRIDLEADYVLANAGGAP